MSDFRRKWVENLFRIHIHDEIPGVICFVANESVVDEQVNICIIEDQEVKFSAEFREA